MATRQSRRLLKPLLYTSAAVTAVGAGVLYISYRPRNIPGYGGPAVSPPGYREGKLVPPKFPLVKTREEQIRDLKLSSIGDSSNGEGNRGNKNNNNKDYDLLVIGGGATGSGIALDAATRGLKVAVIERDDFSSGTSSKSTKLVHGGVRYLEKAVKELDYSQYVYKHLFSLVFLADCARVSTTSQV